MKFLTLLLLISLNVFGQSVNPNNSLTIGKPSSTSDKGIIFDTNDGANNVKLQVDDTRKLKFSGNNMQIGDGSSANNKELIFDPSSGVSLKWNGSDNYVELRSENVRIGNDLNNDITLEFGKGGTNPAIKYDSVKGKLAFSNDGTLFKDIGSGSGAGDGGINLLLNNSFEDGISTNWSNTGGTFTQQPYTNADENNLNYARFVASGSGQYFESDLYVVPDFLTGACLAYLGKYKVAVADNNAFRLSIRDASNEINGINLVHTDDKWLQSDYVSIACPAAGTQLRLRVESLAAGQIEADLAYTGSDNRLVNQLCQGTTECEDIFSAKVSDTGIVTTESLDWINGNCTNAVPIVCTFNTGIFNNPPNCAVTRGALAGNTSATGINTVTANSISYSFHTPTIGEEKRAAHIVCQKSGSDFVKAKPQLAVTNSQSAWFIDANIGGANTTLTTSAVSSYTGIENASLDMVLNSGSAPAEIPCSSTNPSTGLTCSVGNESIGVAFLPPFTGYFDVCITFTQTTASSSDSNVTYQMIETANNAQVVLQEGKDRTQTGGNALTAGDTLHNNVKNCGTFLFSDTSKKTVRLMFEKPVSTGSTSVVADRSAANGQRDIRIKVNPSTRNIPAPVLTGEGVTTSGALNSVLFSVAYGTTNSTTACSASPCSYFDQIGNHVTNITRTGVGLYSLNLNQTFQTVNCTYAPRSIAVTVFAGQSALHCKNCSSLAFTSVSQANNLADSHGSIICHAIK